MSRITSFCYLPGMELIPSDCLYLDASLPPEPAAELSRLGIDTVTAKSAGLVGASVAEQLAHAARAKRMFVTRALPLTLYLDQWHAGVLVLSKTVTAAELVHHVTNRLPMLPLPKNARVNSVPPITEFIDSLHRTAPPAGVRT